MASQCFTRLLLSAPSERIAEVYRDSILALKASSPHLREATVECVADPEGFRVGSGGGTLNVLDYALCSDPHMDLKNEKILMIHSGGDSRRAPLYSLCGKAWITLNTSVEELDAEAEASLATPVALLIDEIARFTKNLGKGSLIVCSSDVLLDIVSKQGPSAFPIDAVTVVSVPEDPYIATNHGVLLGSSADATAMADPFHISGLSDAYLQKPSVEDMFSKGAIYSHSTGSPVHAMPTPGDKDAYAMIDTGVVIFTGRALQTFAYILYTI